LFFIKRYDNKTVKELRKNQGLTVKELANSVKVNPSLISKVDQYKLKTVPEPLKSKLDPVLKGKHIDKAPWL